ncbi:MAG TPA: universal stress protein [Actinomycetota bacterium]|jgi:nucleotide-binding universal stress UspA family protein|nr:universal stress protein [Actinomycetota bacterium]
MFERLLLAVDGSEHSKKAAAAAAEIAQGSNGKVHVLHVHEVSAFAPLESSTESQALVDGVVDELLDIGVKAMGDAVAARTGSTAATVLDGAMTFGSDLIVMGTRGLSDFSGLLLGSIAHKVIQHADCPVLVTR